MNRTVDKSGPAAQAPPELYAITVAFELKPGERDRFLKLVRANAAASLREEPNCLRFDVLVPAAQSGADVLLYEIYADRLAFETHLASAHFIDFDAATRHMVTRKAIAEFATRPTTIQSDVADGTEPL